MAEYYIKEREYRDDVKKLRLDSEEKQKAKELINRIDDGEIEEPRDFLDEWKELDFGRPDNPEEVEKFVKLENIKGSNLSNRLSLKRLERKLNILLNDDWTVDESFQAPHLIKNLEKETYHVGIDGHHRIMAFKAVGIDKIWARYEEVSGE